MSVTNSKIWGPNVWYFIHQIAYSYIRENRSIPEREQRLLQSFMLTLRHLLPCPSCRAHFGQTLTKYPVAKENKKPKHIFNWTIRAHNLANKGLKKKVLTYAEAEAIHKQAIAYNKFEAFINVILIQSTNKALATRRAMAICTANLFPCVKCRPALIKYYQENHPKKIKNNKEMTEWAHRFLYTFRRACRNK